MKLNVALVVLVAQEYNNRCKLKIMILGVCEWLSTKTQFTAKNIRILLVLLVLFGGLGIGAYIILWLVKLISGE